MPGLKSMYKRALEAHRAAVESTYTDTCSIIEYVSEMDTESKITAKTEQTVQMDIPCRLSYEKTDIANQQTGASERTMDIKLFLSPEIDIRAGSKINVVKNGITKSYSMSGEPAVYEDHQEVMLTLFERWA